MMNSSRHAAWEALGRRRSCSRRRLIAPAWTLLLLTSLVSVVRADETAQPRLDPDLPYQGERSNPVTYDVDFSVVVTAPYGTKRLQVWLPVPPSDVAQQVSDSHLSSFPQRVEPQLATEPRYGNRFAYFEFARPQGAQIVRHQFRIRTWQLDWRLDAAMVETVASWPSGFDRYRRSDRQGVVVDERFQRMLAKIVPASDGALNDLTRVMRYVQNNFQYDHTAASLAADSQHALAEHRGHCSDYHSFCAALGRAMGYPTRVAYGINPFPKASPSHCKFEAYLPPYGWVPFDVSETQKMIAAIGQRTDFDKAQRERLIQAAQRRLASGFRDNTWFLQTRGTDYDLVPPATRRVPVVRTAYMEADGVPLAEPDPSNANQTRFSWMTVHDYRPDRPVAYPYTDIDSLFKHVQE